MSAPPPSGGGGGLDGTAELSPGLKALFAIISVCLVIGSGLVSGLTLGLLSQDEMDLEILRRSGTPREAARAARVSAVLAHPHHLLCTLVLVNAACSVSLPIFLDRLLNAAASILISITGILIFGEILPQAICARHGVAIGAFFAPLVRVLMFVLAPVAWPLAKILDHSLGKAGGALNRPQLQAMVSLHHEREGMGGDLTKDEVTIIQGALRMAGRTGRRSMTPIGRAFMVSDEEVLDAALRERILMQGHSRIPVYRAADRTSLVGLILAKELLHFWGAGGGTGPGALAAPKVGDLLLRQLPRLPADTSLYDLLNVFQTGRSHMAALMDTREEAAATAAAAAAQAQAQGAAANGGSPLGGSPLAGSPLAGGHGGGYGGGGGGSGEPVVLLSGGGVSTASVAVRRTATPTAPATMTTKAVAIAGDAAAITSTTTTTGAATGKPVGGGLGGGGGGGAPIAIAAATTPAASSHVAVTFATDVATDINRPPPQRGPSLGRRLLARLTGGGGGGGGGDAYGADAHGRRTISGGSAGSAGASGLACAARTHSGGSDVAAVAAREAVAAAEAEAREAHAALDAAARGVPVGIITLEDVLEELMGEEILDETDTYADVATRGSKEGALASMLQDVPPHMRKLLQLHLFEAGKVLARATPLQGQGGQRGGQQQQGQRLGAGAGAGVGAGGSVAGGSVAGAGGSVAGGPTPPLSRARTPGSAVAAAVAGGPGAAAAPGVGVGGGGGSSSSASGAGGGRTGAGSGLLSQQLVASSSSQAGAAAQQQHAHPSQSLPGSAPTPPLPPPLTGRPPVMVPLPRGAPLALPHGRQMQQLQQQHQLQQQQQQQLQQQQLQQQQQHPLSGSAPTAGANGSAARSSFSRGD